MTSDFIEFVLRLIALVMSSPPFIKFFRDRGGDHDSYSIAPPKEIVKKIAEIARSTIK